MGGCVGKNSKVPIKTILDPQTPVFNEQEDIANNSNNNNNKNNNNNNNNNTSNTENSIPPPPGDRESSPSTRGPFYLYIFTPPETPTNENLQQQHTADNHSTTQNHHVNPQALIITPETLQNQTNEVNNDKVSDINVNGCSPDDNIIPDIYATPPTLKEISELYSTFPSRSKIIIDKEDPNLSIHPPHPKETQENQEIPKPHEPHEPHENQETKTSPALSYPPGLFLSGLVKTPLIRDNTLTQINRRHSAPTIMNRPPIEHLSQKCSELSLTGENLLGYCIRAYDGDTCTLNIRSNFGDHQWRVRLLGFDAPEIKTKDMTEKIHALACRDVLLELIEHKYCVVSCQNFEKYGRLLGTIFIRTSILTKENVITESCQPLDKHNPSDGLLNVNEWMLAHTPCVPYDGGTKNKITYDISKYHPIYLKHFHKHNYKYLNVKQGGKGKRASKTEEKSE
jgi:endonuclease YncB( thermonuclease family)